MAQRSEVRGRAHIDLCGLRTATLDRSYLQPRRHSFGRLWAEKTDDSVTKRPLISAVVINARSVSPSQTAIEVGETEDLTGARQPFKKKKPTQLLL